MSPDMIDLLIKTKIGGPVVLKGIEIQNGIVLLNTIEIVILQDIVIAVEEKEGAEVVILQALPLVTVVDLIQAAREMRVILALL